MQDYNAPLQDMMFVLDHLVDVQAVSALSGLESFSRDLATAVLDEADRLAHDVLSPLNHSGDAEGARWTTEGVITAPGWQEAYAAFVEGGWSGLTGDPAYGGQGLPFVLGAMVEEIWNGANIAFTLCALLGRGAAEALRHNGSAELTSRYLPQLVTGHWAGAMDLTEPQAGSDLSMIRASATLQRDGTYRIHGQKIFITYGDHDLTENIVHLVLARTPDAPPGIKGISLFLVPKFLLSEDGSIAARNDLSCISIEKKLGIHASPTCTMQFGAQGSGAIGWLLGEENRGLQYMFVMMNAARFGVALQSIGIAERAFQQAAEYANERIQGDQARKKGGAKVAIAQHPDVARMLITMRSKIEAMRALGAVVAEAMDIAHRHPDAAVASERQAFVDLMVPVVKGWFSENAIEIASLGIQIHGGLGFVEETGAAQHLRDARITTIYEGTTGIQAADLVGRKIARDGGNAARATITQIVETARTLAATGHTSLVLVGEALESSAHELDLAVKYAIEKYAESPDVVLAGSGPMLELFGVVSGAWQLARSAAAAYRLQQSGDDAVMLREKIAITHFYAEHLLPASTALRKRVINGASALALIR